MNNGIISVFNNPAGGVNFFNTLPEEYESKKCEP
jgi:hypothetical protein